MKTTIAALSLVCLTGCFATQRSDIQKGMTFWETKMTLNPVSIQNVESKKVDGVTHETFEAVSYPCPAEWWTYRLVFVDGKLDKWLETKPTGPATFECKDRKTVVAK